LLATTLSDSISSTVAIVIKQIASVC